MLLSCMGVSAIQVSLNASVSLRPVVPALDAIILVHSVYIAQGVQGTLAVHACIDGYLAVIVYPQGIDCL